MKIGLASIYSYRPHVEHLAFLAQLLRDAGHELYSLTCDAAVPSCYSRLLRGHGKWRECPKCMAGGLRSFPVGNVRSIRRGLRSDLEREVFEQHAASSAYTLHRTETLRDSRQEEVLRTQRRLAEGMDIVYANAMAWIEEHRLDGVLCFNGRMDHTRAVTLACERSRIPYVTTERAWFGHGLVLVPNGNCISLKELDRLTVIYRDRPLTRDQAAYAARLAAERFLQKSTLEWRLYNPDAQPIAWPGTPGKEKVLLLPGSTNEFAGHPEWNSGWDDATTALDELVHQLHLDCDQLVLRCHPNWAERIGRNYGYNSERHYTDWARSRGVHCISSGEQANTYDLIASADIVVVNGSTSAIEAGACGKKVICLGPAQYQSAGFTIQIHSAGDWTRLKELRKHNAEEVARKALRCIYVLARRFPQYVDFVRARTSTHFDYFQGADPERLAVIFKTGRLEADDSLAADNTDDEARIVSRMLNGDWEELAAWQPEAPRPASLAVRRRFGLRWIDGFRELFPRGDR